jgi:hypothetical protein
MMIIVLGLAAAGVAIYFLSQQRSSLSSPSPRASRASLLACPACGSWITAAGAPGSVVRCQDCGAFAKLDAAQNLAVLDPSTVAPTHVYETYLPEAPRWPNACCVCCAPATRAEPMSISYEAEPDFAERMTAHAVVGLASAGMLKVGEHVVNVTERYAVPHCDAHSGGAKLAPAGIAFRSYAYQRQFVQLNRGGFQ